MIVYADGSVQKDETIDPRKISHLQLPFSQGQIVIMTVIHEGDFPLLIIQSEKLSSVGFKLTTNGQWKKIFTVDKGSYKLRKAFGHILIGVSCKDHTLKMLELGGKMDNVIVTEMAIGLLNSPDYYLDAK